jgi:hypothetical protein
MTQPGETSAFVLEKCARTQNDSEHALEQLAVRESIASSERPDWWQLKVTDGSLTGPAPKHAECRLQPRIRP